MENKNNLKAFSSYETHNLDSFYDSETEFDRYVGFFIDKDVEERGYIVCIDTDEIDLEEFKSITNADITVKQKISITNEVAILFFKNKIKNDVVCKKEVDSFVKHYSREVENYENEDDDDFLSVN